jgi:hypothetical protein
MEGHWVRVDAHTTRHNQVPGTWVDGLEGAAGATWVAAPGSLDTRFGDHTACFEQATSDQTTVTMT